MEPHNISIEERPQDVIVLADGHGPEELRKGKSRARVQPYARAWEVVAEHCGERPQVVVLDENEILGGVEYLQNAVGEAFVRCDERAVDLLSVGVEVSEHRRRVVLAEALVEGGGQVGGEENWMAREASGELRGELVGVRDRRGGVGRERADEDDGVGESAGELEGKGVGIDGEVVAVRGVGIGHRAEGQTVSYHDSAWRWRLLVAGAGGGGGGGGGGHCDGEGRVWGSGSGFWGRW